MFIIVFEVLVLVIILKENWSQKCFDTIWPLPVSFQKSEVLHLPKGKMRYENERDGMSIWGHISILVILNPVTALNRSYQDCSPVCQF